MKTITKLIPQSVQASLKRFLYRRLLTFSQAGQDFWVYGEAFNEQRSGFFLDIGAHDGIRLSNTYILELKYKWTGLCIEANPITFEKLKQNRRSVNLNICLDQSPGKVKYILRGVLGGILDSDVDNKEPHLGENQESKVIELETMPLSAVLEQQNAPSVIDYLSIDIEGAEERVLAGFNFEKYTFRCMSIERPSDLLRDLFKEHGYVLIKEIPRLDCFYVHHTFLNQYRRNLFEFYQKKYVAMRWR